MNIKTPTKMKTERIKLNGAPKSIWESALFRNEKGEFEVSGGFVIGVLTGVNALILWICVLVDWIWH